MAQIEAFLRTGEAPPAAPEPPLSEPGPLPPTRRYELSDGPRTRPDGPVGLMRPAHGDHVWNRLVRTIGAQLRRVDDRRRRSPGDRDEWVFDHAAGRGSSAPRTVRDDGQPPRWTPARVVVLAAVLIGLLAVPAVWPNRSHGDSGAPPVSDAGAVLAGPGYQFVSIGGEAVRRWTGCSPVYFATDLSGAPAWAGTDLGQAMDQIARASGIKFVPATVTGSAPVINSDVVTVRWHGATPTQSYATLDAATGRAVLTGAGSIVLGPAADGRPAHDVRGGLEVLMLQQLGRLLGLRVYPHPGNIMSSDVLTSSITRLGPGDVAGLRRLAVGAECKKSF